MTSAPDYHLLDQFSKADDVDVIWLAARQLMAQKLLAGFVQTDQFNVGFDRLKKFATEGSSLDRLLALDLLVRLPAASKKLSKCAERKLREILYFSPPPLQLVNNTSPLPNLAKPADIRENIAISLKYASGEWVEKYLLKSIIDEKQSQRTRDVLIRELVARKNNLGDLLESLVLAFRNSSQNRQPHDGHLDLLSICQSLSLSISQDSQKFEINLSASENLDALVKTLVHFSGKDALPPKVTDTAIAIIKLLDDILKNQLTLFVEHESYLPLQRIHIWWSPRSYPEALRAAMAPVMAKLVDAISIRARMGQKSEELVQILRRVVQDTNQVARMRKKIADNEKLTSNVDDWLRGKERKRVVRSEALRRALQHAGQDETDRLIGRLLISANNLKHSLGVKNIDEAMSKVIVIFNLIQSAALQRLLETDGTVGDVVDYNPTAHETSDMAIPLGHKVRLATPMIVKVREDGTRTIIVKGIVTEVNG